MREVFNMDSSVRLDAINNLGEYFHPNVCSSKEVPLSGSGFLNIKKAPFHIIMYD